MTNITKNMAQQLTQNEMLKDLRALSAQKIALEGRVEHLERKNMELIDRYKDLLDYAGASGYFKEQFSQSEFSDWADFCRVGCIFGHRDCEYQCFALEQEARCEDKECSNCLREHDCRDAHKTAAEDWFEAHDSSDFI